MEDFDWMDMMKKMQDIRLFSSLHVRRAKKGGISSSQELDLLSRIELSKDKITPQMLCNSMGLSKPIISRLIEQLELKDFLKKETSSIDKRSYFLLITKKGSEELNRTYEYYLKPIYELRRRIGEEKFHELTRLIHEANDEMIKNN